MFDNQKLFNRAWQQYRYALRNCDKQGLLLARACVRGALDGLRSDRYPNRIETDDMYENARSYVNWQQAGGL
jgi:hypothetical protein